MISVRVCHDGGDVLGVLGIDEVDLRKLTERGEVRGQRLLAK